MAGVVIRPRSRILHGHDWVFRSEILKVFGDPLDGQVVSIKDGRDRSLGSGLYNGHSQITVRRFSRRKQDLDREFFDRRITQARDYRLRRGCSMAPGRVVWGDADGLPGLIVDVYGRVAVAQFLALGMDQRKEMIAASILANLPVDAVVERGDAPGRRAEGLDETNGLLAGEFSGLVECICGGVSYLVDPLHGQKTGLYLDQLGNYDRVARYAAGRSVADCFANQGGFALACAKAGAASVVAIESGAATVETLLQNVRRNELAVVVEKADVFSWLPLAARRNRKFDLIILDPPSFARDKGSVRNALKGYHELHMRAAGLLNPDGLLATFTCSHHISPTLFRECISAAFFEAKTSFRVVEEFSQSPDHPVLLHLPETGYLHGLLLEAAPGR